MRNARLASRLTRMNRTPGRARAGSLWLKTRSLLRLPGRSSRGALKIITSSHGLRPAGLLRAASLARSPPVISDAFSFGRKDFEGNHRCNRYQRIVLFVEAFITPVQIEEAKLSHANLPRSEYENLEFDLRGGGKRLFFEVPCR